MSKPILICPNCGNHINAQFNRSFGNKAARFAAKKGGSAAAGAAIGSIFPVIGTAIGAAAGFAAGLVVDAVADEVETFDCKYDYECGKCGRTYHLNESQVNDMNERTRRKIKKRRIIPLIISYLFFYFCSITGLYFIFFKDCCSTESNWQLNDWLIFSGTCLSFLGWAIWSFFKDKGFCLVHCAAIVIFWIFAKGINLLLYSELHNTSGELTSLGWCAWIMTIIGGVLSLLALIIVMGSTYALQDEK